jgi:hypothetical protein
MLFRSHFSLLIASALLLPPHLAATIEGFCGRAKFIRYKKRNRST